MKDFHPRKIVLWVHVLPLTINGSCCLLVRSAAWLRGFRVSPESDGATRAVRVGRAPGASTDLDNDDMRAVYAIPNWRIPYTQHGLQYSKLTTPNDTVQCGNSHDSTRFSRPVPSQIAFSTQGGRRRTSRARRRYAYGFHFTRPAGTVSYCSVHGLRRGATRPRHATEGDTIQQVQACLHSAGVQYSSNGAATDAASIAFSMVPRSSQGDRRSVVSRFSRDGVEVVRRTSLRVKVRRPLLVEMNLLISA